MLLIFLSEARLSFPHLVATSMARLNRHSLLLIIILFTTRMARAYPILTTRSQQPFCVNQNPPDSDLTGLGVRIGVYLQIFALTIAVCCGKSDTLSAIPAAIMTSLTLNIVLTFKVSMRVFDANPVVQDFWITQCQLYLLVTLLPYMFLFSHPHYKLLGKTKCYLVLLTIVYTYGQTLWFWTSGYKNSDEVVCGVLETMLFGRFRLFTDHGRYAILIVYGFGLLIILSMLPNFVRGRPGYFAPLIRKVSKKDWVKGVALGLVCAPWIAVVLSMVEDTARKGSQAAWVGLTGQWLALGVGVCTASEAIWSALRAVYRELSGGEFSTDGHFFGVDEKKWIHKTIGGPGNTEDLPSESVQP